MTRSVGGTIPGDAPDIASPEMRLVQIQTQSRCNGACVMCPWPDTRDRLEQGAMSWTLFRRIVNEVAGWRSVKLISLMLQNEPLLDGRLPELVRYVRERCPQAAVSIATNGSLLDERRTRELVDAGLSTLVFSVNALRAETFARVEPSLDFDTVMRNLERLRSDPPQGLKVFVKMLVISENEHEMSDVEHVVDFMLPLKRAGFTVSLDPISNRAGSLKRYGDLVVRPEGQSSRRKAYCHDPFGHFNVLFDGRVLACCADWNRRGVLGDLSRHTVREVWEGELAQRWRQAMLEGDYMTMDPCRSCSQALNILEHRRELAGR